jgi:hypothetical protein
MMDRGHHGFTPPLGRPSIHPDAKWLVLAAQSLIQYVNSGFDPLSQAAAVRGRSRWHAAFLWLTLIRRPFSMLFQVHGSNLLDRQWRLHLLWSAS